MKQKRSMEYLEAAVIAYFWYLYVKLRFSDVPGDVYKAQRGWENFRKHGILFVKKYGTEKSRTLLSNFLDGAKRRRKGPLHFLLQDR